MATGPAWLSSSGSSAGPPLSYFAPRPQVSYYAPRPAPSQRYTPPQQRSTPAFRPPSAAPSPGFSALSSFAQSDAGQEQIAKVQEQQQAPSGFDKDSGFGGLGFIINNPVTRAIVEPLKYLDVGRKALVLGAEEAAEGLAGAPSWVKALASRVPGLYSPAGSGVPTPDQGLLGSVDVERTEADPRSNWEKLNPNSEYGYGQLLNQDKSAWVRNIQGFSGDIALDPLTYVGNAATRLARAPSHVDEAARGLEEAGEALRVAQEAGKARDVAKAARRVKTMEEYVARAPSMGERFMEMPLPSNRAGRINLLGELEKTPEGQLFLRQMPEQAQRGARRGFQAMSQEAKNMLGVSEPGLSIRGMEGMKIPGTRTLAKGLIAGGGAARYGVGELPYADRKIANIRVPKGMLPTWNVLSRGKGGNVAKEAATVALSNMMREGSGAQLARGNRIISNGVKKFFKGLDKDAKRALTEVTETSAERTGINEMLGDLLDVYQKVSGRIIDPEYLQDPDTYLPHLLDPHFRRALGKMAKNKDQSALDFIHHLDFKEDDLLEEPTKFFADNLMEGSGFISKARRFGTNKETGAPQTFTIGGRDITFSENNVGHLNEQLKAAFPEYKGDFYDTDPVRIMEAYNKSLSRQAGRDLAAQRLADTGSEFAKVMGGELDATRLAMNEALSQQGAAPLLSTAQGKYVPATGIVPEEARWTDDVAKTLNKLPVDEQESIKGVVADDMWEGVINKTLPENWNQADATAQEMARRGHLGELRTAELPEIPPTPVVPGSAAERAPIEKLRAAAEEAADPAEKDALVAEADRLQAEVTASRIGGVEPSDYFVTTKGKEATAAHYAAAKRGKTYATAIGAETRDAEAKLRGRLAEVRETIITPLRTTVTETKAQISVLNKKLKTWAKTITDMGDLNTENMDEFSELIANVENTITNAETKLARGKNAWKGQATRAQRNAEADLRASLRKLKVLRDQAWEKADNASAEIASEIRLRESALNQPVRDAHEKLLRAEMEFARGRHLPHDQATVEGAMDAIEHQLANTDTDPEELLGRFREVLNDVRTGAEKYRDMGAGAPPDVARLRTQYADVLDELKEIGSRRKRGKLTKKNQALMDEAMALKGQLALALGQGKGLLRGQLGPPAPRPLSAFDQAQVELANVKAAIKRAQAAPTGGPAEIDPELLAKFQRGEIQLSELGKGEGVGDVPRLRAERDRLARQFQRGGRFHKEQGARDILKDAKAYDEEMELFTEGARKELEQAMFQRTRAQESIIWKSSNRAGERYTVPFGQNPSLLEEMGRGVGQERHVEPIPPGVAPQEEAWATEQDVWGPEGPTRQAIPPPRSEQEALASLQSIQQTGGTGLGSARAQARGLTAQAIEQERTLPERIVQGQAAAAAEVQARADQALGPLAERAQTYTNLLTDLSDKKNMIIKRDEAAKLRDQIRANPTNKRTDLHRVLDDLDAVAKANPYLQDEKLNQVESLLQTHRAELERIDAARIRMSDLDRVAQDAADGTLGDISIVALNNNWHALHNGPLNTGDLIMDMELYKRFNNLFELSRQPKIFGRTFNAFTNLFKTYATLSPGFHIRNTLGGIFMNTSDGVTLAHQLEGAQLWQKFTRGGEEWLDKQPKRIKDAFSATFASGAGGRFEESGVLAKTENRLYNWVSSNRATRLSQRAGTRVEGGLRLGMALDSISNGASVQDALSRISRIHFDYAQVSEIDETMKRIIPFWTFMSRNLPLQIEQMWTKPRVYAYYNSLIRNFSLPDEKFTPDYWTRQGAWRTPVEIAGSPLYLQPDLGFTRVQSDMRLLQGALSGENPGALLAQSNPLIGGTMDYINKRDSFYNRQYDPTDYSKKTGLIGAPLTLLAKVFGQTNEAGQVSDNFTNYMQSLIPPLNQGARLFPGATGGDANLQTATKWARYAGMPVQLLTPEAQDSEYWRQYREILDEQERQQSMLEEAAS